MGKLKFQGCVETFTLCQHEGEECFLSPYFHGFLDLLNVEPDGRLQPPAVNLEVIICTYHWPISVLDMPSNGSNYSYLVYLLSESLDHPFPLVI